MIAISHFPNEATKADRMLPSHQKESQFRGEYVALTPLGKVLAAARFYGHGQTHYCCLWLGKRYASAKAGGGGYHKDSAALETCLYAVHVTFKDEDGNRYLIGGRGDIEGALKAAVAAVFPNEQFFIYHSHP